MNEVGAGSNRINICNKWIRGEEQTKRPRVNLRGIRVQAQGVYVTNVRLKPVNVLFQY